MSNEVQDIHGMSNKDLALILNTYNHWRRGDTPFEEPGCLCPVSAKELGLLIDETILRLKEMN